MTSGNHRYSSKGVVGPVTGHVPELDGLRGIACLMVVLLHTIIGITPADALPAFLLPIFNAFFYGGVGVDLFFVLSGFLIGGILIDNNSAPNYFKVFWVRRAARILPVYLLLMSTFAVAIYISASVSPNWFHDWLMINPIPIWTYITFTQNYFMAIANEPGPRWVAVTWSLAVEEQFYVIFPFVVYFFRKKNVLRFSIVLIVFALLVRDYIFRNFGFYSGYLPTPARADGLMFGVLVAYAVRSEWAVFQFQRFRLAADFLAVLAIVALGHFHLSLNLSFTFTLRSLLFAYILGRVFISDDWQRTILKSRFLVFMGAISYPFYMYHQAVNGLFHGWIRGSVPRVDDLEGLGVAVLVISTAAGLATLSTWYFEKPFRDLGKRVKYLPAQESVGNSPAK